MIVSGEGQDFMEALRQALENAKYHCQNKYYEYSFKWSFKDVDGYMEEKINQDTDKSETFEKVKVDLEVEDLLHN